MNMKSQIDRIYNYFIFIITLVNDFKNGDLSSSPIIIILVPKMPDKREFALK